MQNEDVGPLSTKHEEFQVVSVEHQTKSRALLSTGPWVMAVMQENQRPRAGRQEGHLGSECVSAASRNLPVSNAQFRFP